MSRRITAVSGSIRRDVAVGAGRGDRDAGIGPGHRERGAFQPRQADHPADGRLPEADRPVRADRDDHRRPAVGSRRAEGQALDRPRVVLEPSQGTAGLRVPDPEALVDARADERAAVGEVAEAEHPPRVPFEGPDGFSAGGMHLHGPVEARRGPGAAVVLPGECIHEVVVRLVVVEPGPLRPAEELDRPRLGRRPAPRGEDVATG